MYKTIAELSDSNDYQSRLHHLTGLQAEISQSPYNVALRLALADAYQQLFYPDLAAGEAYKALLLVDEINDESGEYHELAMNAAKNGIASHGGASDGEMEEWTVLQWAQTTFSEAAYLTLVHNLLACSCLRSACEMCIQMLKKHPNLHDYAISQRALVELCRWCDREGIPFDLEKSIEEVSDAGSARRELYPWNCHEPDRFSNDALELLNTWMTQAAPKLEVKATELPVLSSETQYVPSM